MFAVLKTGGKQYKVSKNDVLIVEKLSALEGDTVQFDEILMLGGENVEVGSPKISGAAVHAEVIEQKKDKKVISFVKRRRKHSSQRTKGHRQSITVLRIKDILKSGANTKGVSIETGSSVIASKPVVITKTEVVKKPANVAKAVAKKPAATAKEIKDPTAAATKAEVKKPVNTVKVASKKPASNAKPGKKPLAEDKTTKKNATKKPVSKK
jgi:large subunit ribosomal protein L21